MIHGWYTARFADTNRDELGCVPTDDSGCLSRKISQRNSSAHGSLVGLHFLGQGKPTTTNTEIILSGTPPQYSRLSTKTATFRPHAMMATTVEMARMTMEKMNQVLWADGLPPRARRHCLMSRREGFLVKGGRVSSQDSTTRLFGWSKT